MQLLGIFATFIILGCLPLCFGKCPTSACPGDEVCVKMIVMHLCRHSAKEGDVCSTEKDKDGVYNRHPPCESGCFCSKDVLNVCKKS